MRKQTGPPQRVPAGNPEGLSMLKMWEREREALEYHMGQRVGARKAIEALWQVRIGDMRGLQDAVYSLCPDLLYPYERQEAEARRNASQTN